MSRTPDTDPYHSPDGEKPHSETTYYVPFDDWKRPTSLLATFRQRLELALAIMRTEPLVLTVALFESGDVHRKRRWAVLRSMETYDAFSRGPMGLGPKASQSAPQ